MPLPHIATGTHTSTLSCTSSSISSATALGAYFSTNSYIGTKGYAIIGSTQPTKVYILGEEFEFDCYVSQQDLLNITLINILGSQFYNESTKNGIKLPEEVDKIVRKKLMVVERDSKINNVINDK